MSKTTIYPNILRRMRNDKDMTLAELSQATGISVPYLSKIENGLQNPSIDTLWKLSRAYGLVLTIEARDNRDYFERKHYSLL